MKKTLFAGLIIFFLSSGVLWSQDLTVIRADADLPEQTMNWGKRPVQGNDEPIEGWVVCMMCASFSSVAASSTLAPGGGFSYGVKNLSDDNPGTAWVEGKPDYGIGESFTIKGDIYASGFVILNGLQASESLFLANSRVKRFKVYLFDKAICYVDLEDKMGRQRFHIEEISASFDPETPPVIKFEIVEIYPGTKYKDTCISELYTQGG